MSASNAEFKELGADHSAKNCFFLWSNLLILVLTGIPLVSFAASKFFNTPVWFVPKVYELKLYALALISCALLSFASLYFVDFFRRTYAKYQFYLLFFYPLTILLYSTIPVELLRYLAVFVLNFVAIVIFCYESIGYKSIKPSFVSEYYNALFIAVLGVSVFLILYYSEGLIFTLHTSLKDIASLFVCMFIFLRWANLNGKYFVWMLPFFLFAVTFLSMGGTDVTHYSFFLGPVLESMYGHYHPLVLNVQYGGGLTAFLVGYFKLIGMVSLFNMQFLLKFLTLIQFLLVYAIGVAVYQSRKIAALVLITTLFFSFYSINGWNYYMAPSIGFLRFGFIYLILFCYTLENKVFSKNITSVMTALLAAIACIWSFESAIYTLPAFFFAEYINKNLKKIIPAFIFCLIGVLALYLAPFILEKQWPPISHYYEYALLYANGFGQISMGYHTSIWWLFPLLYGFILIKIIMGEISNKIIVALTIYGMAIFTYFGGRAHPASLLEVAIPFIMLAAYLCLHVKLRSNLLKQTLFILTLIGFFTVNNVLFSGVAINVLQEWNIPFLKESYLAFMGRPNQVNRYEYTKEASCSALPDVLLNYIESNSLAVLSTNERFLLNFHACTKTYNAFLVDPLGEVVLNPAAIARTKARIANLSNRYVLIDANLLDPQYPNDLYDVDLFKVRSSLLENKQLQKVNEIKLPETTFIVFSLAST